MQTATIDHRPVWLLFIALSMLLVSSMALRMWRSGGDALSPNLDGELHRPGVASICRRLPGDHAALCVVGIKGFLMLPNSNTPTRPNRPMVRWLLIAGGALLALIVTFTCGIVVAGALAPAAAPAAAAHTQPVPPPDPTPAAAPVRSAPVDDPYYSDVEGELLGLTDDLTALMTHGAQIGKPAQKANPAAWTANGKRRRRRSRPSPIPLSRSSLPQVPSVSMRKRRWLHRRRPSPYVIYARDGTPPSGAMSHRCGARTRQSCPRWTSISDRACGPLPCSTCGSPEPTSRM